MNNENYDEQLKLQAIPIVLTGASILSLLS